MNETTIKKMKANANPRADYDNRASGIEPHQEVYVHYPLEVDSDGDARAYLTQQNAEERWGGIYIRASDLIDLPTEESVTVEALRFAAAFLAVEVDIDKLVGTAQRAETLVGSR